MQDHFFLCDTVVHRRTGEYSEDAAQTTEGFITKKRTIREDRTNRYRDRREHNGNSTHAEDATKKRVSIPILQS